MRVMAAPRKYPDELRERATRMAVEARRDPATKPGALARVGKQLGINPETLRNWGRAEAKSETWVWPVMILTSDLVQPLQDPLWLGPAAGGVLLLPRSERPGGSPADATTALGPLPSLFTLASAQVRCSSDDFASPVP